MFALLLACHASPPMDTAPVDDTADTPADTDAPILERRLRANYEREEGLNLADGAIVVLGANNETEPEAEHADLHATLGRYIALGTYAPTGEGRLCAAGAEHLSVEAVPTEGCDDAADWTSAVQCAVNSDAAESACAGLGFLVRPLGGDARYRMRVVTDAIAPDGDYLASVTVEIQAIAAE